MNVSTTLRPSDVEWLALSLGPAHAQPKRGRGRAACGAPRIDPRFHHPGHPRCVECLAIVGIVVRP